jgi:uncharacterized protein (UPF0218 family)
VNPDVTVGNVVATGIKRKLKKKMKKLQKQDLDEHEVFSQMQKAQRKIHKINEKNLFNPKSELVDRRKKRMDRLKANRQKHKKEILQKME